MLVPEYEEGKERGEGEGREKDDIGRETVKSCELAKRTKERKEHADTEEEEEEEEENKSMMADLTSEARG